MKYAVLVGTMMISAIASAATPIWWIQDGATFRGTDSMKNSCSLKVIKQWTNDALQQEHILELTSNTHQRSWIGRVHYAGQNNELYFFAGAEAIGDRKELELSIALTEKLIPVKASMLIIESGKESRKLYDCRL